MDYDWRGFIFLFAAIMIFVALIMMVAGVVILIQRARSGRKRNRWTIPPDEFSG